MKLTKKLEAEILKVYHAYWDAYLKGDMKAFTSMLDENCTIIGSSENEVFNNKKEAVKFYKATAKQVAGKAEMRNRNITMMPVGHSIMVNEQSDFFVLIDNNWTFYGNGRISTQFHKKNNKWKIIHQHGSLPDSKAGEGEQINTDKIKAENIQLRNAVKRRTIELEEKNHELEIEAALERVRTVATSMRRSEELITVCESMYKELTVLGFANIRNAQVAIKHDEKQAYLICEYSDYAVNILQEAPYDSSSIVKELYNELGKSTDALYQKEFSGKEFEEWRTWRKSIKDNIDPRIDTAVSMCFYLFSMGTGHVGISTFNAITNERIEILKRFKNVFELSYQRYTDVANAEAQAREAQMELALERVRARTMAMQRSDELSETVFILFQQFKQLGENPDQATIGIINEDEWLIEYWVTMYGNQTNRVYKFPIDEPNVTNRIYKAWKEQKKSMVIDLSGKELYDFANFRESMGGAAYNEKEKKRVINVAFFSKGLINVQSNESRSAESLRLLERFAGVFEQTYTRFLDLQKAEAQAREAQIEAALERVRSRTMGMQKSDELKEVIQVVYEQFVHLNIKIEHTGFVIDYKARDDYDIWIADPLGVPSRVTVPYFDSVYYNRFNEAKEKGEDFFATNLSFEEKNKFYQKLFEYVPGLPEEAKKFYFSCPALAASTVLLENVCLYIENFSGIPYTDEENNTLMRFGKVFQQTYTRFLDLQKAEAQAREAKIEAALEKVRSRSLAMHKSDELNEVVTILFEKIKELQIPVTAVGIGIYIDGSKDMNTYVCGENEDRLVINNYCLPYFHHKIWKDLNNAREKQLDFFSGNYSKEEKNSFYKYVLEHSALRHLPDDIKSLIFESPAYIISMVPVNHSMFMINDFEGKTLSENEVDIIKRFARVFDQTYTRFLDLQKAEAQAREAKIEAALERVRSRTMAMQKSEELSETAQILFQQFRELGEEPIQITIGIINEEKGLIEFRVTDWSGGGSQVNRSFNVSIDEPSLIHKIYTAWKDQKKSLVVDLSGKELQDWIDYRNAISGVSISSGDTKGRRVISNAFFSKGHLSFSSPEPRPPESIQLLERFAGVFDLTYTRFLDLKNAEAQAREATIEASLERVRSKTMAMHNSQDVGNTVATMFDQLVHLGVKTNRCGILIFCNIQHGGHDTKRVFVFGSHLQHTEMQFKRLRIIAKTV